MTTTLRGGTARPIEPGMLERIGQRLRATLDVWFGPLAPLPPIAPADTPPRRFDYPSGVNLVTLPRNYEAVSFQQMRDLADSLDLVRIAIETRKDQVSKMPWSFREKTRQSAIGTQHSANANRQSAVGTQHSAGKQGGSPRGAGTERLARGEHIVGTHAKSTTECRVPSAECLVDRIDELTRFFQSPDGEHEFSDWLRMIVEELLVIDAVFPFLIRDLGFAFVTFVFAPSVSERSVRLVNL